MSPGPPRPGRPGAVARGHRNQGRRTPSGNSAPPTGKMEMKYTSRMPPMRRPRTGSPTTHPVRTPATRVWNHELANGRTVQGQEASKKGEGEEVHSQGSSIPAQPRRVSRVTLGEPGRSWAEISGPSLLPAPGGSPGRLDPGRDRAEPLPAPSRVQAAQIHRLPFRSSPSGQLQHGVQVPGQEDASELRFPPIGKRPPLPLRGGTNSTSMPPRGPQDVEFLFPFAGWPAAASTTKYRSGRSWPPQPTTTWPWIRRSSTRWRTMGISGLDSRGTPERSSSPSRPFWRSLGTSSSSGSLGERRNPAGQEG